MLLERDAKFHGTPMELAEKLKFTDIVIYLNAY